MPTEVQLSGHAPEFLPPGEWLVRWIDESSDLRLSLFMLAAAMVIAGMIYFVELRVLA